MAAAEHYPPRRVRPCEAFSFGEDLMSRRNAWAQAEALALMGRWGLSNWQFGFNRRKRAFGLCRFPHGVSPGRIELSVYAIECNSEDELRDTILHEIAHALAGEEA